MDAKTLKREVNNLDGLRHLLKHLIHNWRKDLFQEDITFFFLGYYFLSLTLFLFAFKKLLTLFLWLYLSRKGLCWLHILSAQLAVQAASQDDM